MQANIDLSQVHDGMKVYDADNKEIGKVDWVRFGEDDPATEEPETVSGRPDLNRDTSLLDVIAKAFTDDEVPDVVRDRLLMEGFVRIDSNGLFRADRYVEPSQIADISGDAIHLKVTRDQLVKLH
jgi:hypothetical protein